MKKLLCVCLVSIVITSCAEKAVAASPVLSDSEKLVQGKTIFENSCNRCHELPTPTDFSSVEWVGIMNAMAPKAKLSEEQHQWVYNYVVSVPKK